jgi:hypothetical protein
MSWADEHPDEDMDDRAELMREEADLARKEARENPEPGSTEMVRIVAPGNSLVLPLGTPDEMHHAMQRYEATKQAVLEQSDYQQAERGKRFIKKSGWAKLAIAFGVTSEIVRYDESRDDEGHLLSATFVVRAIAPNGRAAEGWGRCHRDESRFKWEGGRQKLEHDLPATAETRARNRAYAALFGHGEVSAEEVAEEPSRPASAPRRTRRATHRLGPEIRRLGPLIDKHLVAEILTQAGVTGDDLHHADWPEQLSKARAEAVVTAFRDAIHSEDA